MMKVSPPPANYAVLSSAGEHGRFCREKVMAAWRVVCYSQIVSGRWPEMRRGGGYDACLEGGWAGKVLTFPDSLASFILKNIPQHSPLDRQTLELEGFFE